MAEMSGFVFLMAGLGDGHMLSYQMDRSTGKLSDAKKFTIGAQQVRLNHLRQEDGRVVVFACADHPTVVHADGDKLRFANVNIKVRIKDICVIARLTYMDQDLSYISTFNTEATPNALAFVAKDSLKIGSMESIQRLHIKTVPLGETPRRIAHQEQNRVFGLLTTKVSSSEEEEISSFKIVDDQTYEGEFTILIFLRLSNTIQFLIIIFWRNLKSRRAWSHVISMTTRILSLSLGLPLSFQLKKNHPKGAYLYLELMGSARSRCCTRPMSKDVCTVSVRLRKTKS
jgi:hypothetical protein